MQLIWLLLDSEKSKEKQIPNKKVHLLPISTPNSKVLSALCGFPCWRNSCSLQGNHKHCDRWVLGNQSSSSSWNSLNLPTAPTCNFKCPIEFCLEMSTNSAKNTHSHILTEQQLLKCCHSWAAENKKRDKEFTKFFQSFSTKHLGMFTWVTLTCLSWETSKQTHGSEDRMCFSWAIFPLKNPIYKTMNKVIKNHKQRFVSFLAAMCKDAGVCVCVCCYVISMMWWNQHSWLTSAYEKFWVGGKTLLCPTPNLGKDTDKWEVSSLGQGPPTSE